MKTKHIERLQFDYCPILGLTFYLKKHKVFNKESKFINNQNKTILYKNR